MMILENRVFYKRDGGSGGTVAAGRSGAGRAPDAAKLQKDIENGYEITIASTLRKAPIGTSITLNTSGTVDRRETRTTYTKEPDGLWTRTSANGMKTKLSTVERAVSSMLMRVEVPTKVLSVSTPSRTRKR